MKWRTLVDKHSASLAQLARARSLTHQNPPAGFNLRDHWDREEPAWLGDFRKLGSLVVLQALTAAEEQRPADAITSVQDLLRMAWSLEELPWPIAQEVRQDLVNQAARTTAVIVTRSRFTDSQLAFIQDGFARVPDQPALRHALTGLVALGVGETRGGYAGMEAVLGGSQYQIPSEGMPLHVLAALHFAAGLHLRDRVLLIDRLHRIAAASDRDDDDAVEKAMDLEGLLQQLNNARVPGLRPLTISVLSGVTPLRVSHCESMAYARAARLICAIERHRLAHENELPDNLTTIDPALLPSMPADPFDGCPMRYRRLWDGYVVYSVGQNGVDDSGLIRAQEYRYNRRSPADAGLEVE